MRAYWLVGCMIMASCGAPAQVVHKGGQFVDVGADTVAVFTQAEHVTVIKLGQELIADAAGFTKTALTAIAHTTRCGVKEGSLRLDSKSMQAVLECIKPPRARLRGPSVSVRVPLVEIDLFEGDIAELDHP